MDSKTGFGPKAEETAKRSVDEPLVFAQIIAWIPRNATKLSDNLLLNLCSRFKFQVPFFGCQGCNSAIIEQRKITQVPQNT